MIERTTKTTMEGPRRSLLELFSSFLLGSAYVVLTLPNASVLLGRHLEWMWVQSLGSWALGVNTMLAQTTASFPALMSSMVVVAIAYLLALLILSVRHGNLALFGWGAFTLFVATAVLHIVAWLAFVSIKIILFGTWILGIVSDSIHGASRWLGGLLHAIIEWPVELLRSLIAPIAGSLWWVVASVAFMAVLYWVVRRLGWSIARTVSVGLLSCVAVYLVVGQWALISKLFSALGALMQALVRLCLYVGVPLLVGLIVLVSIMTVGQLLMDQVRCSLIAGNGRRGVITGAIAVGASLAILLLVSNVYGTDRFLPEVVEEFSLRVLFQPAPILDALIALIVTGLCILGVLSNLPALKPEPTREQFGKSMVYSVVGVFVAAGLAGIAGETER